MSGIDWIKVVSALRNEGETGALYALDMQGYAIVPKKDKPAPKKWDDYATLVLK